MIQVSAFLTIDAGVDEVFDYLADLRNYPDFLPSQFQDFHFPDAKTEGEGGRINFRLRLGKQRLRVDAEFTEVVTGRKIELADRNPKPRFRMAWRLMYINRNTKITLELDYQPVAGKLGELLTRTTVEKKLRAICKQGADGLRERIAEPLGSPPPPKTAARPAEKGTVEGGDGGTRG